MHGKSRDRGYPLIGNQHDPGAALFGGSGKFQHAGVIAADIEEHHDIALPEVEGILRPVRRRRRDQGHMWPCHLQMHGKVTGDGMGDATAAAVDAALSVIEQADDLIEDAVVEQPERAREVFRSGDGEAIQDMGIGRVGRPALLLGDRILQLRREFGAQFFLKGGKPAEAQLLRQAQDAGCRDVGLARELGDAGQPRHGIVGKERCHQLPLGGGQLGGLEAQAFCNRWHGGFPDSAAL
jgi:hypothetical protein